jgi:hypothetical protein
MHPLFEKRIGNSGDHTLLIQDSFIMTLHYLEYPVKQIYR